MQDRDTNRLINLVSRIVWGSHATWLVSTVYLYVFNTIAGLIYYFFKSILNQSLIQSLTAPGVKTTCLMCVGIFKCEFVANISLSLPAKELWKSVNVWESFGQEFSVLFFDSQCSYKLMLTGEINYNQVCANSMANDMHGNEIALDRYRLLHSLTDATLSSWHSFLERGHVHIRTPSTDITAIRKLYQMVLPFRYQLTQLVLGCLFGIQAVVEMIHTYVRTNSW